MKQPKEQILKLKSTTETKQAQEASYQSTHQQMEQKIPALEQQNAFFQQQIITLQNSKDGLQKTTEAMLRIELKQLQQTYTSGFTDSKTSYFDFTESALAMAAKNLEHSGFSSGGCKSLADPGKQLSSGNNNEPSVEVEPTVRPPLDVKRHDLVLFVHRVKFYRFDTFSKQWKERGIGKIKIRTHT